MILICDFVLIADGSETNLVHTFSYSAAPCPCPFLIDPVLACENSPVPPGSHDAAERHDHQEKGQNKHVVCTALITSRHTLALARRATAVAQLRGARLGEALERCSGGRSVESKHLVLRQRHLNATTQQCQRVTQPRDRLSDVRAAPTRAHRCARRTPRSSERRQVGLFFHLRRLAVACTPRRPGRAAEHMRPRHREARMRPRAALRHCSRIAERDSPPAVHPPRRPDCQGGEQLQPAQLTR